MDQNYQELNYSNINSKVQFENLNIDFNYIEEDKHIGSQEYLKSKISYKNSNKSLISLKPKEI